MKRIISILLLSVFFSGQAFASEIGGISAKSAVLAASDGTIMYELNADEQHPPASVTKIMTMLLAMEAIDRGDVSLDDMVTASANACSMGGTQIYLKEGEQLSLDEMMKSIAVGSANDAAVAVAEFLAGSESAFVDKMNERAKQLGCSGTAFVNPNGLDVDGQETLTTARDIAKISCELLKHEKILDYTTIWMDTVRDGSFQLANTNKLLKQYQGMNGLKTGYTSKAGFCISAAAKRDDMQLIAVVMGEPNKEARNADITAMLNYGFAEYTMIPVLEDGQRLQPVGVELGKQDYVSVYTEDDTPILLAKSQAGDIERKITQKQKLSAPVAKGTEVGEIRIAAGGKELARRKILSAENCERKGINDIYRELLSFLMMKS